MAEWLGSRETGAFTATWLAMGMLHARTLLGRPGLGGVQAFRCFRARAGVRAIARRHAPAARFSLERGSVRTTLVGAADARPLIVAEPFVRPTLALVPSSLARPAASSAIRHRLLQFPAKVSCDPNQFASGADARNLVYPGSSSMTAIPFPGKHFSRQNSAFRGVAGGHPK